LGVGQFIDKIPDVPDPIQIQKPPGVAAHSTAQRSHSNGKAA
jgi:hypothetical protein